LLTADGSYAEVRERGWPLAGLETSRTFSSAWNGVQLVAGPDGDSRMATYRMIYKTNPWVWAACQRISQGIATVPLKTYRLLADGQRERVRSDTPGTPGRSTGGQQLDALLRLPSPQTGQVRLVKRTVLNKLVYGNGLWTIDRNGAGVPSALYHVPWRKVTVHAGEQVPILAYEVKGAVKSKGYAPEDVVHFVGGDDTEDPVGISPLSSLRATLALHEAIQRHLVAYYANEARPSGVLQMERMPKPKDLEEIRETIRQLYAGPENAGRLLITSGKFQSLAEETGTPALIELIKASREEVCAAYGIAPPLVGILDRAIKSNVKELRDQFYRDVVGPNAEEFEDDIGSQLLPQVPAWRYHFVEFDLPEKLRPDPEGTALMLNNLKTTMGLRERRRFLNLPDLEIEGDDLPEMSPGAVLFGQQANPAGDPAAAPDEPADPPDPGDEPDPDDEETI
jgi:HK97 family phage portal protein